MKFFVTIDPNNEGEIVELEPEDIIYLESGINRSVIFHTVDKTYYPVVPMISHLEKHLQKFGFRRLDRTNLVNVHKIKKFDDARAIVFFEPTITNSSKFATISNFDRKVKIDIEEWINRNNEKRQKD